MTIEKKYMQTQARVYDKCAWKHWSGFETIAWYMECLWSDASLDAENMQRMADDGCPNH